MTKKSIIAKNEEKVLKFWQKNKIFEKSVAIRSEDKAYVFYDGPPFATGLPHYGNILASVIKDAIPRYWTMKGYHVKRRWGWDCHGLPIENIAEQEMEINSKNEIEKMGIGKFNKFCRSKVQTYANEWKKVVDRVGRWVEFDDAYKTMDNDYMESVWWAFKKAYDQELIYQGEKILMYCPRCETPLANAEIAMDNSYKTVKEETITVKFKLADEEGYVLSWTTTPWTLPSNLALTVNKNLNYVYLKDKTDKQVYILSEEAISKYWRDESEYEVLKKVRGKELIGKKYEPLFPYFKDLTNSFKIIEGDFVTAEDGTGIVHTAPAFGEEDYQVCRQNKIDFVQPVNESGEFTKEVSDFAGMNIIKANPKIIDFLKKQKKLVRVEKLEHEYPFCYRCETPLMYRAIPAWFVDIQKIKKRLLELNEKMNWYPGHLKHGRFANIIKDAPDWNISRNRYWATALPIWRCQSCDSIKVLGSIKELKKEATDLPKDKVDLHKDFLDQVHLKCKCGQGMERVPEVFDCWMESGSMPFAQYHYPFENKKIFEVGFPGDFVAEYIAQTRTWFYYCLVMSTLTFDDIPYKHILTTGTIMAEDGSKMSKSKKNYPDPWLLFERYGVDALRFYLLAGPLMKAESVNFSERDVDETYKKLILTLWNVLEFYKLYHRDEVLKKAQKKSSNILDQWIMAKLKLLHQEVTENMDKYNLPGACRPMLDFVQELSTWYVRRSRGRFKDKDNSADFESALTTLREVLISLAGIIAPITPFIAETVYQETKGPKHSVHLEDWSKPEKLAKSETALLENMTSIMAIVEAGHAARQEAGIKVRQPLSQLVVTRAKELEQDLITLITEELNVKEVIFSDKAAPQGADWHLKEGQTVTVALDITITDELKEEGIIRELIRQVNSLRKKANLTIEDKITLGYQTDNQKMSRVIEQMEGYLKKATIASTLQDKITDEQKFTKEIELDGALVKIGLKKS